MYWCTFLTHSLGLEVYTRRKKVRGKKKKHHIMACIFFPLVIRHYGSVSSRCAIMKKCTNGYECVWAVLSEEIHFLGSNNKETPICVKNKCNEKCYVEELTRGLSKYSILQKKGRLGKARGEYLSLICIWTSPRRPTKPQIKHEYIHKLRVLCVNRWRSCERRNEVMGGKKLKRSSQEKNHQRTTDLFSNIQIIIGIDLRDC